MSDNPWDYGQGWSGPDHDGKFGGSTPAGPPASMPVWAWLSFPAGVLYTECCQRLYIARHPEVFTDKQPNGLVVAGPLFQRDNTDGTLGTKLALAIGQIISLGNDYAVIGGMQGGVVPAGAQYYPGFSADDLALVDPATLTKVDFGDALTPYLKSGWYPPIAATATPTAPTAPTAPAPIDPVPSDPHGGITQAKLNTLRSYIHKLSAKTNPTPADDAELALYSARFPDYLHRFNGGK